LQKADGLEDVVIDFMEQVHNQSIKEESDESDKDEEEENDFNEVAHKMNKDNLTEFFKENLDVARLFRIDTSKELPMVSRVIG
jgi:hypothetical protein